MNCGKSQAMTRSDRLRRLKAIRKWIAEEREVLRDFVAFGPVRPPASVLRSCTIALRYSDELILDEMAAAPKPKRMGRVAA